MLTVNECRRLLGPLADEHTDEELKMMMEFLEELAIITIDELKANEHEKESSIDVPCVQ